MLPEVEKLLRVQHHDQKIKTIDKELAGIPVEAADIKDKLVEDQRAVEAAKLEMQHTEVAVKNLEIIEKAHPQNFCKVGRRENWAGLP